MKNQHMNEQTEKEVLQALVAHPKRYFDFTLKPAFFSHPSHIKVMEVIEKKMLDNATFSLVDLLSVANEITISDFFQGQHYLNLILLPNYLAACKELVDNYAKRELYKLLGNEASPTEIKDKVEQLMSEASQKFHVSLKDVLLEYEANYQKIRDRKISNLGVGIQTSWIKFNDLVGLRHQDVLVIGARPSIGKTAFGINLALEVATAGQKVLFISAEMGLQALVDRFVALATGRNISAFRYANQTLGGSLSELGSVGDNLNFVFGSDLTSQSVIASASKLENIDLVIVDYLQLLGDKLEKGETENNRISRISRNLKKLAINKNCAVVALAQLNRGSEKEKREPRLSDIRDSGSIEQDADSVILLHREKRDDNDLLARVAKNRNGEVGDLNFFFDLKVGSLVQSESIYTSDNTDW